VDPAKILGLLTYCTELGMVPAVLGLMGVDDEMEARVREKMASFGDKYGQVELLIDPARFDIVDALKKVRPHVVIGSCTEEDEARPLGIPGYAVTFPMISKRVLFPRPLLGFDGALIIAEELANRFYVDTQTHRAYTRS
ncbi:MAG: hypothetical protein HY678_04885, partial [Chloroflexi bacterium]|nr:hypothetical protein [Chloroflexota bacterium]